MTRSGEVSKIKAEALQQTVRKQEMWMEKKVEVDVSWGNGITQVPDAQALTTETPAAARERPIFVFTCKPLGHTGQPLLSTVSSVQFTKQFCAWKPPGTVNNYLYPVTAHAGG